LVVSIVRVLVVGAGIAGTTLAYWLLRGGHQPTLVERAPELRRGGYLIDFWGSGFDVAERMGILPELRERGYRLTEARFVAEDGRLVAALDPTTLSAVAPDRYLSLIRSDLAAVIYGSLSGRAELLLDDGVEELDDNGDRVRVRFTSGDARDFDLVVGADGLHSRVRRLFFGPEQEFARNLGIVVAAFDVTGYRPRDDGVAVMHAGVGFQVARLALRDDVTTFLITARHGGPVPTEVAAQHALLRERLRHAGWETPAIVEAMPRARTFYFDSVSQTQMPFWTRGRVALVGDAAACPSLLAGQGSSLAMLEAYVLAAEVVRSKGDHVDAFGRYQQRLIPLLRTKQDAAQRLGLAFAPASRVQLHARNTMLRLMRVPTIARLAMRASLHDAVELPTFAAV
jgi:2-polyprenyl-6-methoxyphenol hydroxylase-like FAD-dependent oxidoreductase